MEKQEIVKSAYKTPNEMISQALVQGGVDLEKLEKLLNLQKDYEANEARKAYHKSMALFKANPPKIDKDKAVAYGNTKYNHASLGNVTEKINAELSKYGLSASWTTKQNGQVCVTCRITHELGHSEETTLCAASDTSGSKNAIQAIGSTITYLERYTLLALTGLATYEQDDDGQAAGAKPAEFITPEQANEINSRINALGKTFLVDKFFACLKAVETSTILSSDYNKAIQILEQAELAKSKKGKSNEL
jgi:hypothetical protein